jgi:hypothetical protein
MSSILKSVESGPSERELDEAPLLDQWSNVSFPDEDVMRLFGAVVGHPTICDRTLTTSPLFAVDLSAGLARTRSRWYRLTSNFVPANEDEREAELDALVTALDVLRTSLRSQLNDQMEVE